MASEPSPEARELALVGKLELRIGLASSDKKLEDILKLFLAPLLLKLGSESVAVRNKVRLSIPYIRLSYPIASKPNDLAFVCILKLCLLRRFSRTPRMLYYEIMGCGCRFLTSCYTLYVVLFSWMPLIAVYFLGHINLPAHQHPNQITVRIFKIIFNPPAELYLT